MVAVSKGSKTDLTDVRYDIGLGAGAAGVADLMVVLLADNGRVRSDDDFVFFNNPKAPGIQLTSDTSAVVVLSEVPADVQRVLVAASTEAQGRRFGDVQGVGVEVRGPGQALEFAPPGLTTETVLQVVALYRRGDGWRLDAIGQGYQDGLAAFATDHGISVDDPGDQPAPEPASTSALWLWSVRSLSRRCRSHSPKIRPPRVPGSTCGNHRAIRTGCSPSVWNGMGAVRPMTGTAR